MTLTLAPSSRFGQLHGLPTSKPNAATAQPRASDTFEKRPTDPLSSRPQAVGLTAPSNLLLHHHGDFFVPPPVREVVGRTSLHEAIRDRRCEEATRLLMAGCAIDARDSTGQTPLHYAARVNDVKLCELLLEHGAQPDAVDAEGYTPMHLAAWQQCDGAAWLLAKVVSQLAAPALTCPDRNAVRAWLDAQRPPLHPQRYAFLDRITEALSGTRLDLNDHEACLKYVGHLMSMRGLAAGKVRAEGWHREIFLLQRLRSLVAMYYEPEMLSCSAHGLLNDADVKAWLASEVHGVLQSLIFSRHFASLAHLSKRPRTLVEKNEDLALRRAVATLADDQELTLPIGTPSHAIYLNIRPQVVDGIQVIRMRIDNLGAGIDVGHLALERNGRVAPFAFNIPRTYWHDPQHADELANFFINIMRRLHDCKDDIDVFYAHLTHLVRTLSKIYGDKIVQTMACPSDNYWKSHQTAGNCVLKNHSVGVWARLGASLVRKWGRDDPRLPEAADTLWRAFKENESELALDRLWNFVMTPNAFRQRDCASKTAKLQLLLRDKKSRQSGLVAEFLRKPNRATIGTQLRAQDLLHLVADGDVATLQALLVRGVDLSRETQHRTAQESLLHIAVRSAAPSAPQMIKFLLQHGVPGDIEDAAKETPYALAARLRHGEALMALLEAGVVAKDNRAALSSLQACLQRQLDDTQRALALLQGGEAAQP